MSIESSPQSQDDEPEFVDLDDEFELDISQQIQSDINQAGSSLSLYETPDGQHVSASDLGLTPSQEQSTQPTNPAKSPALKSVLDPNFETPKTEPLTEKEETQRQFESATKLGLNFAQEAGKRINKDLAPILDTKRLNPDDLSKIKDKENFGTENIQNAENAAVNIFLQSAYQIANYDLNLHQPNRKMNRHQIEDEIDSLNRIDQLFQLGWNTLREKVKNNKTRDIEILARENIAFLKQKTPDEIDWNEDQLKKWTQDTIQQAGRKIRRLRTNYLKLLDSKR